MAIAWSRYDFAARPLQAERDGSSRIFAGSSLPAAGGSGTAAFASRGSFFARLLASVSPRGGSRALTFAGWGLRSHEVVTPHPASIYPLSHVRVLGPVAAVQAAHSIGEGAPNNGARGSQ